MSKATTSGAASRLIDAADKILHLGKREDVPPESELAVVLKDELSAIRTRRRALGLSNSKHQPSGYDEERAWNSSLFGLALSGGGIRSAAFNLGVIQGLARRGLLRYVDYLSTVSGGGYIGAWLSALVRRTFSWKTGAILNAQRFRALEKDIAWSPGDLDSDNKEEHDAIKYLREFSNYLTPKLGMFSGDTWALFSTYLRNALLNQFVLVLAFSALLLIPRILSSGLAAFEAGGGLDWRRVLTIPIGVALLLLVVNVVGRNLAGIVAKKDDPEPDDTGYLAKWALAPMLMLGVLAASVFPLVGAWTGLFWNPWAEAMIVGALVHAAICLVTWQVGRHGPWNQRAAGHFWGALLKWSPLAGALLGLLVYLGGKLFVDIEYTGYRVVLGPPMAIGILLLSSTLHIGLGGIHFHTLHREWLSRLGGLMAIASIAWLAVCALVLLSPLVVDALPDVLGIPLIAGWLATTFGGVYAGRKNSAASGPSVLREGLTVAAPWVFIFGLLVVLSAGIQSVLHVLPDGVPGTVAEAGRTAALAEYDASVRDYFASFDQTESDQLPADNDADTQRSELLSLVWSRYGVWLGATEPFFLVLSVAVAALLLALGLSSRVDINSFSLHNMYANRLVRCFLGATSDSRRNPFSGFSAQDDLRLCDLNRYASFDDLAEARFYLAPHKPYGLRCVPWPGGTGPYHLVNVAMNLAGSKRLAWQERKAASFVLSPGYCGYTVSRRKDHGRDVLATHAYRKTADYSSRPKHLTLGEAVATSGAAASPNMGYRTTPALAFLMGVFNIRLGRWAPNPRRIGGANDRDSLKSGPNLALWHLLKEVFRFTDENSRFVYLSDGGHFENLGIYELVRRRCRFVVACDSGADPSYEFEDLGNAIRKCRIDLDVEIDIDVREIARVDGGACNGAPCAVGRIRYPGGYIGTLLYVKSSRRLGAPGDVTQYARKNAAFPHESTADQFFSESQFESYRRLGSFLADEILAGAVNVATLNKKRSVVGSDSADDALHVPEIDVDALFRQLRDMWYPGSQAVADSFSRHTNQIDELFERLRTSDELAFLNEQFYPEWRTLMEPETTMPAEHTAEMWQLPADPERLKQGFYFCNSLIQLMENVYLDLHLESDWAHPDNSGWMNVFRHWTWSSMFRIAWAISAATYGRRFRSFCHQRLGLHVSKVNATMVYNEQNAGSAGLAGKLKTGRLNLLESQQIETLLSGRRTTDACVYRLDLQAKRPPGDDPLRSFAFGYAVFLGKKLVMYRVQDHLRNMGLGRSGLEELVAKTQTLVTEEGTDIARRLGMIGEAVDVQLVAEFIATVESVNLAAAGRP